MATNKTTIAAKKIATTKVPSAAKKAVKPVVKSAVRKPVNTTPEPAAKKPEKKSKVKIVRNFSMPQAEYRKIADIKEACLKAGLQVKKSEVLRAGLKVLGKMDGEQLKLAIMELGKIKAGLPKKA